MNLSISDQTHPFPPGTNAVGRSLFRRDMYDQTAQTVLHCRKHGASSLLDAVRPYISRHAEFPLKSLEPLLQIIVVSTLNSNRASFVVISGRDSCCVEQDSSWYLEEWKSDRESFVHDSTLPIHYTSHRTAQDHELQL